MNDEYLFLWAQWGVLNLQQSQFLLKHFETFEKAWKEVTPEFFTTLGMRADKVKRIFEMREKLSFKWLIKTMEDFEVQILYIDDSEYPSFLKQLETAPPFLFVRGKLPSFHKSISVVGTRDITSYGMRTTEKLTGDLVQEGFVIVSGLALGVDTVAHRTTIQNRGITVAVLGSGIDEIYPKSNYRLTQEILDSGGVIISAYPLGTPALAHHFPERNEIVAALTKGTLVIEGGVKSGALITAKLALEYGREVFAVPCNITNLALSGTNHLIRKSAAKLVENIEHILEDFSMKRAVTQQPCDFSHEERQLLEKLARGGKNVDQLIDETTFDIPTLSELLIRLTLKSAIAQQGERWVLV